VGGIGDQGNKSSYTAYADSIRIGNLEFHDCAVEVVDSKHGMEDIDGLIGMNVFSRFLVTLDYPMHKLLLGPLPPRPGESVDHGASLKTSESESEDQASSGDESKPPGAPATGASPPAAPAAVPAATSVSHGPYDRYIAPEMKDYTKVYRIGHDLILPASLNREKIKLFIIDTGAWATTISPDAAREVTKVHRDDNMEVKGISGKVQQVYTTGDITFTFAHLSQRADSVVSFDTSKISKNAGLEISGFIGANTLYLLTIHIDYRDGLVKFDYDPNRGYRF
jgi:hypothetical protein